MRANRTSCPKIVKYANLPDVCVATSLLSASADYSISRTHSHEEDSTLRDVNFFLGVKRENEALEHGKECVSMLFLHVQKTRRFPR